MEHMRFLGIDYGKRKMGFSISEGEMSHPLKVVAIFGLEDALAKTRQVINQEKIDRVVIGVPESGEALSLVKKFIFRLKQIIEVDEIEETLSTYQAMGIMANLNLKKSARAKEDAYAASIILQNYLDHHLKKVSS